MNGIPSNVRPHHWGFANAWLKSSFQRIPETLVSAVARAGSAEPLIESWVSFGKTLEAEDRLQPEGLGADTYAVGQGDERWFVAVVVLPPPEHVGESRFVAMAVQPAGRRPEPEEEDSPRAESDLRYFLLERGDGGDTLLEWKGDERCELESGLADDESSFVHAVSRLLSAETS